MNRLKITPHTLDPLKKNLVANIAGSAWQSLMGLIFVPFYIKFMGVESYGLIGFFATVQVMFGLLNIGLGSTLTREMARLSALPQKDQEMRNLVRTLETLYWSIAIIAGLIIVILSPFIAKHWFNAGQLPLKTLEQALLIMGMVMIFQMPVGFYSGGLSGLQKQVLLNVINGCVNTVRNLGAILILWLVSPTIQAFLLWQGSVSIINAFLLALFLWRRLPTGENKTVFQKKLLTGVWKFTAGMSGISILAVILTQTDKIILSKILSLEMYGYYMLASMVAMSLSSLFVPVFSAIYPKFIQAISVNDQNALIQFYHKSCQFLSLLILPIAIVVAFFSYEIILLWTQNIETAERTHSILSIMICGTAINGVMHLPYALQLAFGWTKLSLYKTLIAVIIIVPLIFYLTSKYGPEGAAAAWLILNIGMFFFEIPLMHRRLLRGEMWQWYLRDVFPPLFVCTVIAFIGRILTNVIMPQHLLLQHLMVISSITLIIAIITSPLVWSWFIELSLNIKVRKSV